MGFVRKKITECVCHVYRQSPLDVTAVVVCDECACASDTKLLTQVNVENGILSS
eukprot:m.1102344 g.1102344  ORF g.1102344 m.1102344 type:complete len:54 (-) comp24326_c0_seq70:21-182(-)